jgi:hypothetical protein
MPAPAQQTLPQGQNWMEAAAAGVPRMVEQVNAAMPKGNTEPSWYEQQTGNPGSRGPTAVQILGMINSKSLVYDRVHDLIHQRQHATDNNRDQHVFSHTIVPAHDIGNQCAHNSKRDV